MSRMRQIGAMALRLCLALVFAFAISVPAVVFADEGVDDAGTAEQGESVDQGGQGEQGQEAAQGGGSDAAGTGGENSQGEGSTGGGSESAETGGGTAPAEGGTPAQGSDPAGGTPAEGDPTPGVVEPPEEIAPTLIGLYLYYQNYDNVNRPHPYNNKAYPTITEARGTMELYAESEMSTGYIDWVANSGVSVVWSIEAAYDADGNNIATDQIATIERDNGIVHALGQGDGAITVRCFAGAFGVYEDMTVYIMGNSGQPYVTDLQICDENGNPYANDEEIRIDSANYGISRNFHVLVTYQDPITGEVTTKNTHDGDAVPNLVWTTSGDAKTAYVNQDTGAFIAQAAGTIRLTATIAGAGKLGDTLADYVTVLCGGDTLDPDKIYSPADELKVVVKYAAEDKDKSRFKEEDYETARTWYYSPSDLEAIGVTENLFTMVKSSGSWASMKARGVYFETLISDVGGGAVSLGDVYGFYFGATDEYNPGFVGAGWLFKERRYYYPNMSIGSGASGAIRVAPMIATWTAEEDLSDEPSGQLSEQTRFRLCFGAESTTINNAQQCIYNIHTITIVLEGAPPVGWDDPEHGHGTSQGDGGRGDSGAGGNDSAGDNPGSGTGSGANADPDNGSGLGDGDSENETNPGTGNDPAAAAPSQNASNEGGQNADSQDARQDDSKSNESQNNANDVSQAATKQQQTKAQAQVDSAEEQIGEQPEAEATPQAQNMFGDEAHRFAIYEMMKKQKSNMEALAADSPFGPLVLVLLASVFAAGGASSFLGFRRNLNPLA